MKLKKLIKHDLRKGRKPSEIWNDMVNSLFRLVPKHSDSKPKYLKDNEITVQITLEKDQAERLIQAILTNAIMDMAEKELKKKK